jgi:hypothetical protein
MHIKEWAIGSFRRYGDKPFQVLGMKYLPKENDEQPNPRAFLVTWKIRRDGFKPVSCYINEEELKEADPLLLIGYLERFIKISSVI